MATPGRPRSTDVPPGWPGDDPTVPDDLARLGGRVRPASTPDPHDRDRDRDDADDAWPDAGPVAPALLRLLPRRADRPEPRPTADAGDADGTQPAGRVLVVMVTALVLAMLVNADALVARAERRPAGPGRDRALAVWHPVQDVSHVLQLHRIRRLGDMLVGDDGTDRTDGTDAGGTGAAAPSPSQPRAPAAPGGGTDGATTTTPGAAAGPAPGVRTPTARDPLRLWVGGDAMAQLFGPALADRSEATGVIDPTVHVEMASGLTRRDYYDWPRALADDLAAHDPEVVVWVVGANDAQGIVLPDGTAVQQMSDPRWAPEYHRRVGALMDDLRDGGRTVLWIGQPPMRDPDFGARMTGLNGIYAAEAATRPWVTFIDPATVVGDPSGAYVDQLPDAAGTPEDVRLSDGVHLSAAGGDRLATHVLDIVRARAGIAG
ncbi:MAG TPA: DUF459 domain-containing protein [Acidimicrobiales bacterium]|nr:DUF459 domain-containing protein [Acidimicrobiales bacterium]